MPDLPDVAFRNLAEVVSFSPVAGAVFDTVHLVLRATGPAKVPGIDAAKVAVSASVSGLHVGVVRRAMGVFAGETRNEVQTPVDPDLAVPVITDAERPFEAVVSHIGIDHIIKETSGRILGRSTRRCACLRVAVPHEAVIVGLA